MIDDNLNTIKEIVDCPREDLLSITGIGPEITNKIIAIGEIAKPQIFYNSSSKISSSSDTYNFCRDMERDKLRITIIEKVTNIFSWLTFIAWSNKNSEYDLVKFIDKIDSEFILWVYIHDSKIDFEFRKNAQIDKEFRDIKLNDAENFIEEIKYIY